ncbi:MAG: hypothetical protein P1P77_17980, partial [Spirochaetaceae bacterium]|nr:hypothetical protein [Spirochaetaceae bacterium]
MNLALTAIIKKEFRQILRDPRTLGILLLVPLFLLVLFGYAVSMDIESLTVGILDGDRTPESRRLAELMRAPVLFEQSEVGLEVPKDADRALEEGRMDAVLVISPGYGRA